MNNASIAWLIIGAYLIINIIVGNIVNQREKKRASNGNYYHSNLPAIVVALASTGTAISGVAFIGTPATTFTDGISVWSLNAIGGMIGILMGTLLIGKPMKAMNNRLHTTTLADLLMVLYDDTRVRFICILTMLVAGTVYTAVQWQSLGTILNSLLGFEYIPAVLIGVVVVSLYSVLGGNKSTAIVGAVQIGIAMIACIYIFSKALQVNGGGFGKLITDVQTVKPEMLEMKTSSLSFLIMYGIGYMGQPAIAVRYFQLEDAKKLPKTTLYCVLSTLITTLVPVVALTLTVQIAKGNVPALANPENCTMAFITHFCGQGASGLIISACLAAIMSTGASLTISVSSTLVKDLLSDALKVDMSGKKEAIYSRAGTVLIIVVSTLVACFPVGGILQVGFSAYGAFGAVFAPVLIMGLRWRRHTKQGAFWGMLSAAMTVVVFTTLDSTGIYPWPLEIHVSVIAMAVHFAIGIAISLLTPAQEKPFLPPTMRDLKDSAVISCSNKER